MLVAWGHPHPLQARQSSWHQSQLGMALFVSLGFPKVWMRLGEPTWTLSHRDIGIHEESVSWGSGAKTHPLTTMAPLPTAKFICRKLTCPDPVFLFIFFFFFYPTWTQSFIHTRECFHVPGPPSRNGQKPTFVEVEEGFSFNSANRPLSFPQTF